MTESWKAQVDSTDSGLAAMVAELESLSRKILNIERQVTSHNYGDFVSSLYGLRKKYLEVVKECEEEVEKGLRVRSGEVDSLTRYFGAVRGSEIDMSVVDGRHGLVVLRLKLIEAWYGLKNVGEGSGLFYVRRGEFLALLEEAVMKLKEPIDFDDMYELYADDVKKLRSLVVSYFKEKTQEFYVGEFNKSARKGFKNRKRVSLLLKEFAIFFEYKGI